MRFSPRIALWLMLGFFAAISSALAWSLVYDSFSYFPAGSPPPDATSDKRQATQPTLPPLRPTDPAIGSQDPSALTIVEFGDYRCSSCRSAQAELSRALEGVSGRTRFIWRDAPVSNSADGYLPARAARCAADQGKFWEMHDTLFSLGDLGKSSLNQTAARLGLDPRLFGACLDSDAYRATLDEELAIAGRYGIRAVPTFFINGVAYEGLVTQKEFAAAFKRAGEQP